ncbi:hypothetical protein ACFPIK_17780 [Algoriphagus aquatilis]|uniref:DNA-directed DNA polymerase family A palm domain-containing protein n=1 Tax=Algoriphagus aquatilis TaxID=490186 RepID=A0ABW0C063_9BACT
MPSDLNWRIPSSFDIEKLIEKDPPSFLGKKKSNLDNFYYLIDLLLEKSLFDDLSKSMGYVELYSNDLQKNLAHNYKDYLDYLKKHGIIQQAPQKYMKSSQNAFIKGVCYAYRLNFPYENDLSIRLIPIIGEVHKKRRKPLIKAQIAAQESVFKKYPILTKWFEHLEIDLMGSRKWIDSHPKYRLPMGWIKGYKKGESNPQLRRLKALHAIEKIYNKEYRFSIDDNVGRFHSNLTNLKSELRNFLTWKGQKLVSVDIKNSQPLLSLMLLDKSWYLESSGSFTLSQFPTIHNPLVTPTNPLGSLSLISPSSPFYFVTCIMSVEFLQHNEYQDIVKYKNIVNSGEFYKKMHLEIFKDTRPFDKAKMKEMTFQVFYSDNKFFHQDGSWKDPKTKKRPDAKPKRLFEAAFPTLAKVFRAYKEKDNNNLPRLLQQIESTLVLKHIVPRIASERPDLPIFTIHDSLVTTVGNEAYVERIMREEIERLTGLQPRFGIEYWTPESVNPE